MSRNFDICFRFRVICEKLLSDPPVLFLVTAAMFFDILKILNDRIVANTLKNNCIKFGWNWLCSFRGEDFLRMLTTTTTTTDDDDDDDDGRQVMAIAHMDFAWFSLRLALNHKNTTKNFRPACIPPSRKFGYWLGSAYQTTLSSYSKLQFRRKLGKKCLVLYTA